MIYITADLHLGHQNICLGTSKWIDKNKSCRNFNNPDEMYNSIVESINDRCQKDDTLIIAGDVFFGSCILFYRFIGEIIPQKIVITLGNHDTWIKEKKESLIGRDLIICDEKCESYNKRQFIIKHYPPLQNNILEYKNAIFIHGHCHHSLDNDLMHRMNKNIIDVGWDGKIYSLDEIIEKTK